MEKLDWYGHKVTPYSDIIDTRDILAMIDDLELDNSDADGEILPEGEWNPDGREMHRILSELVAEIGEEACHDGVTLIHESHFDRHIREEHNEIGPEYHEQDPTCQWERLIPVSQEDLFSRPPFNRIDWKAVARDEWSDYSQVEFLGTTYLYLEP